MRHPSTRFPRILQAALAGCALLGFSLYAAEPIQFEKGDKICVIGNALADRFQHDGWLETVVHSQTANLDLTWRDMGFSGDQVAKRPRSAGWSTPEWYFNHIQADVILAFFGYNESFGGDGGLANFEKDLMTMVGQYQAQKFNGKSAPRIVLFAPIAHEDVGKTYLPDGKEDNVRLEKYAKAMEKVAAATGVGYVDLFTISQQLYQAAPAPLTLNGIHLTAEGNRVLAEAIGQALFGKKLAADKSMEPLRQAVLDKNWHWHNRYRATDGNDTWGGRSKLSFVDGQTNATVLQHELEMLDVMTQNRDAVVWAAANGKKMKANDSNVPPPVKVVSNVGGGSKSSNAQKEGSVEYMTPAESLKATTVQDGFELNVFADETRFPELVNPVQMSVDTKGRLWVAAWKTYPKWEPLKEMNDTLLILPDADRDGIADKAITFAKVHNPTGFEFWNNGVLVVSQPDILYLRDTNGDDVADERVVLFQGLDSADTHHAANNLTLGPDGGYYYQRGVFHVSNMESPWGPSLHSGQSGEYRLDPRTFSVSFHAKNSPNSHGISFDKWGYHYATDGTSGNAFQVVPSPEGGFKMRKLLEKKVRPVPSSGIISSAQFPDDMQGDFMICNTIGFLGIKRYNLEYNTETGEVNGVEQPDLLSSTDKNFRPTDAVIGDDGGLYIADWQNVIIGHMQHNVRDPNRDKTHGRVFRLIAKDRPLAPSVAIAGQPIAALLQNLENPILNVRYRTQIELSGRDDAEVIKECQKWMKQFDPAKAEDALPLLEALWVHQQRGVHNEELLKAVQGSPELNARNAANVVEHYRKHSQTAALDLAGLGEGKQKKVKSFYEKKGVAYVRIVTVLEKLQYDTKSFTVKTGQKVELTLVNEDFVPHNLMVVTPGAVQEVAEAAIALGAKGFEMQFRPESPKILYATKLLDNGKSETLKFAAPKEPGDYEFVCTFPGHWQIMRGIMKVVAP